MYYPDHNIDCIHRHSLLNGGLRRGGICIDYYGPKHLYKGAKDEYRAGSQVNLTFDLMRDDCEYSFFMDSKQLDAEPDNEKGYMITYTMPDHDAALQCIQTKVSREIKEEMPIMMVDYYRATIGANGPKGYYEMVPSTTDTIYEIALNVYFNENTIDKESVTESYIVPYIALEECYAVIAEHRMSEWNGIKDTVSVDGALTVCRYVEDGKSFRVTSEAMPEMVKPHLKRYAG